MYAGRRNGTVDVWDTRQFGRAVNGVPRLLRTLRNPISSGAVSCVAAFPDGRHIAVYVLPLVRFFSHTSLILFLSLPPTLFFVVCIVLRFWGLYSVRRVITSGCGTQAKVRIRT